MAPITPYMFLIDISTLGSLLMGALAVYALGYGRGVPRVWLLSAAVVFMLGGVATGRLQHMTQIRSLELPAGTSEIIMNYHPVPFMRHHSCDVM